MSFDSCSLGRISIKIKLMMIFRKGIVLVLIRITPLSIKKTIHRFFPQLKAHADFGQSLISEDRLQIMLGMLQDVIINNVKGDIIECGCYKGGATVKIAKIVKDLKSEKKIFALDTFEGHPYLDSKDGKTGFNWTPGYTSNNFEKVSQLMREKKVSDIVKLYKGRFIETFGKLPENRYCFALIDADIYLSTKQCLEYLLPRMNNGGTIVFDDYGLAWGVKKAAREMIKKKSLAENASRGYAYYIKK